MASLPAPTTPNGVDLLTSSPPPERTRAVDAILDLGKAAFDPTIPASAQTHAAEASFAELVDKYAQCPVVFLF